MKTILKAALVACLPTAAFAEPVIVPSEGSVPETIERLKASVEDAGARVFGVVDFGGGVKSIGKDVGEVQLVIFGDPRIGARALSADRMAALDLPGKVLVYNGETGTEMAYQVPAEMLAEWDIPSEAPILQVMADTLDKVTAAAVE